MSKRLLNAFAIIGLCLQIAVPQGFMPGSLSEGWYLKWCPDGMSPQTMHALFGHAHHHHDDSDPSFAQCNLSGFSNDSNVSTEVTTLDSNGLVTPGQRSTAQGVVAKASRPYWSRAPPYYKSVRQVIPA